jgi:hypothetical protein
MCCVSSTVVDYLLERRRVRAALRAAALRCEGERRRAAERACRASAFREAVRCDMRFSARRVARDRFADGRRARLRVELLFFFRAARAA